MFKDLAGPNRQRLVRIAATLALGLLVAVGLYACGGGGGASKSEIAAAEKRGRTIKAEKEKERKLENEIHQLRKEREEEKKAGTAPARSAAATQAPVAGSERSSCGGSLAVGPDTTCAFAENVRSEYENEFGEGSGTVYAYSAANNEIYEMFCTAAPHECSGAINATVFFP